jgi:copper(I)-binding protein
MQAVPIVAIALAGAIHLGVAPMHYAHAPAHGIFFAVAGIVEILWALAFWRQPSLKLYFIGLALAGGLVVLWAITRALPAPFGHGPEAIEAGGLVCKVSELTGIIALMMLAWRGQLPGVTQRPVWRVAGEALALALIMGWGSWGLGYAATPWLPTLDAQETALHTEHTHDHEMMNGHQTPTPLAETHLHGEPGHDHDHEAEGAGVMATSGALHIESAWARPAEAGGMSAAYLVISNVGETADALVAAKSEVAQVVELHQTRRVGDVMQMQPVEQIEVPAKGRVELVPGGYHLMLIGLQRELHPGERFPLVLRFEKGGEISVDVEVRQP